MCKIGDSISANINIGHLAHATNAKFSQERAYSSVNETASNIYKQLPKFPNLNFTEVVPAELRKGNFHYLVLQAPSVDITNLNTNVHPYSKHFQHETIKSTQNFFSVVENALEVKPTLHKVIVLKLIPRYDPPSVDPLGLKSDLSKIFNEKLDELCMSSPFQSKVFVGSHNIDCTGAMRESRYWFAEFSKWAFIFYCRYRQTKTGKFDGIHMFGSVGREAYTLNVLNILKSAKMTSSAFSPNKQQVSQSKNKNPISPFPNKLKLNKVKYKTSPIY